MSVNSVPWAAVWIDGQTTFEHTPVVDYKTACGTHVGIQTTRYAHRPGRERQFESVTLGSGGSMPAPLTEAAKHHKLPAATTRPIFDGYHGSTVKIETTSP
jgi:hypothetical protein